MPKPPTLPLIEWSKIFESGRSYDAWIEHAESQDHAKAMEAQRAAQRLEPHEDALLAGLPRTVHVVAIAEDWCGDVVRHVPVLQRLADAAPKLRVRFVTREQYPDVFARFLTNGGEAIPKFVFLSDQFVECGHWGPMPAQCRVLLSRGKACGDIGAAREKVNALYQADADKRDVVRELLELIDIASSSAP